MTAHTLPGEPIFGFASACEVETKLQQIRIAIEGLASHVPTALVALSLDDALSICEKLNHRLGLGLDASTMMVAASMCAGDKAPDGNGRRRAHAHQRIAVVQFTRHIFQATTTCPARPVRMIPACLSRTEFMLGSSEAAAIEILDERLVIALDDEAWDDFVAVLDALAEMVPAVKTRHAHTTVGSLGAPEPLASRYDVTQFSSGVPTLVYLFRGTARVREAKGGARTYVACDGDRATGFYSLAASSVKRLRASSRVVTVCRTRSRSSFGIARGGRELPSPAPRLRFPC